MSKLTFEQVQAIDRELMDLLLLADPSETVINSYINRSWCFAAKKADRIVGIIVLMPTRPETVEIVNIAVTKHKQGKGYGKQLVQYGIQFAKEKGFKTIEIGTGNSSLDQLAVYQKCGFRITGIDRDFFVRHYTEEIYENGIQCRDMIRLSQDL
jgi:RimJ/RimL family protein N-acetyltransferase